MKMEYVFTCDECETLFIKKEEYEEHVRTNPRHEKSSVENSFKLAGEISQAPKTT